MKKLLFAALATCFVIFGCDKNPASKNPDVVGDWYLHEINYYLGDSLVTVMDYSLLGQEGFPMIGTFTETEFIHGQPNRYHFDNNKGIIEHKGEDAKTFPDDYFLINQDGNIERHLCREEATTMNIVGGSFQFDNYVAVFSKTEKPRVTRLDFISSWSAKYVEFFLEGKLIDSYEYKDVSLLGYLASSVVITLHGVQIMGEPIPYYIKNDTLYMPEMLSDMEGIVKDYFLTIGVDGRLAINVTLEKVFPDFGSQDSWIEYFEKN